MKIIFCPEIKDYKKALEYYFLHKKKTSRRIFLSLCIICIGLNTAYQGPSGLVNNPITWLLLMYAIFFNRRMLARFACSSAMKNGKIDKHHFEEKIVTLKPEGIYVDTTVSTYHEKVAYTSITDLYKEKKQIIVMLGDTSIFYIPKRFFSNEGEYDIFYNELLKYYERAKKIPADSINTMVSSTEKTELEQEIILSCEFDFTAEDYINTQLNYNSYMKHFYIKSKLVSFVLAIFVLAFAWFGIDMLFLSEEMELLWGIYMWFASVLFLYIILAYCIRPKFLTKFLAKYSLKYRKQIDGFIGLRKLDFTNEGLFCIIKGNRFFTEWSQIGAMWEEYEILLLANNKRYIASLPYEKISEEKKKMIYSFVKEKINTCKN